MSSSFEYVRSDYALGEMNKSELSDDPMVQLERWLNDARAADVPEPSAMCVATCTPEGRPSARFVLLRGLDGRGLTFYTNYESRKGGEIESNPFAAATFWWPALERQVRVEGTVARVSAEESDAYFNSRPTDSRLASAASPQSKPVSSREELEALVTELSGLYPDGDVPRPDHWGGYRISPARVEFWHGRKARLHDRIVYERSGGEWVKLRIAP